MKIVEILVGTPKEVEWQGKKVLTGIFKYPVLGTVMVNRLSLEGDGQADLTVHGGIDKAVYAYSADIYSWWRKELKDESLAFGAFGENLTVTNLDESKINIGDVFQVGECQLQVVQPRFPCFKLGIKFGDLKILNTFNKSERPGIYFRVLKEGKINLSDDFKLIEADPQKIPVIEFFHFYRNKVLPHEVIKKILAIKDLNQNWRAKLAAFLEK